MFTFFNNPSNSNNPSEVNRQCVMPPGILTAIAATVGAAIWFINAVGMDSTSRQSLSNCFLNNNVTDADRRAVEECWSRPGIGGGRASAGCDTEYVYDRYTEERCGAAFDMNDQTSSNSVMAGMFLLMTACSTIVYACSQSAGRLSLSRPAIELLPLSVNRTEPVTTSRNALLSSSRSTYRTLTQQEERNPTENANMNA